jgi:hypothetical protein
VLRVGNAYERATTWRSRRPQLTPGAKAPPLIQPDVIASSRQSGDESISWRTEIDPSIRTTVEEAIKRAGLTLSEEQRALLYRVAPTVLAAVRRIHRDHAWTDEPANAFFFDDEPR